MATNNDIILAIGVDVVDFAVAETLDQQFECMPKYIFDGRTNDKFAIKVGPENVKRSVNKHIRCLKVLVSISVAGNLNSNKHIETACEHAKLCMTPTMVKILVDSPVVSKKLVKSIDNIRGKIRAKLGPKVTFGSMLSFLPSEMQLTVLAAFRDQLSSTNFDLRQFQLRQFKTLDSNLDSICDHPEYCLQTVVEAIMASCAMVDPNLLMQEVDGPLGLYDIVGLTTDNQEAVVIAAIKVKLESLSETGEIIFILCPTSSVLTGWL
jgi:hypothetical protein